MLDIIKASLDHIQKFQHIFSRISGCTGALTDLLDPFLIIPHLTQAFFDICLIDIKIIRSLQDMVFFPDNLFHISVQMLFQKIPVKLLFQKPCKKFIHVMQHILQCFVEPSGIDKCCPEHIQIHPRIIFKREQCRIDILDIDLCLLQVLRRKPLKGIHKYCCIIRNYDIRHQCIIIFNFLQPSFSDQPVQNPCRWSLQHIKLSLIFFSFKFDLFLHIQIPKHLNTDFPGQEIIAVLVFFIDRHQSLNVCFSVHRTKQTPETLRNFKT